MGTVNVDIKTIYGENTYMNKTDLLNAISTESGLTKKDCEKVLDARRCERKSVNSFLR